MSFASILLLCWERYDTMVKVLDNVLNNAGYPYQLLITDQGSKDPRVVQYLDSLSPYYFRKNSRNEGVGKSQSQMFLRSTGDYIVLLGNDLDLDKDWLKKGVEYLDAVPNSGLASFDWGHDSTPPLSRKLGVDAHFLNAKLNRCFGVTMFKRRVVDEIGLFYDGYHEYGLEDSDWNERVNLAGFSSFYVPGIKSRHLENDVGEKSEYRAMKDESMQKNADIFWQRLAKFNEVGIREPLPPMMDPI
jgi:GT2 family glycosyltransferase